MFACSGNSSQMSSQLLSAIVNLNDLIRTHCFAILTLLLLEPGADSTISQGGKLHAEQDPVSFAATLRTCSGSELYGSVGRAFNTNTA